MTEKRFVLEDEVIIDNNSIADDGGRQLYWTVEYVQRQKLVDLMNTLAEENKELRTKSNASIQDVEAYSEENTYLKLENEQLKQQMRRLYNYFADWFDGRVAPSDFSEMWDFVKEDEKWD